LSSTFSVIGSDEKIQRPTNFLYIDTDSEELTHGQAKVIRQAVEKDVLTLRNRVRMLQKQEE